MGKTIREINERIEKRIAVVVTADEMTSMVREAGAEQAAAEVDVVTTGTFGAMCSSGVFLNFGHTDPPIRMTRVWLNDVEVYAGVAAVDAYLGATQSSETLGMEYGGAHVIEDLLAGRPVVLRAVSYGTDCYPRKEILGEIGLEDINQAVMVNPRNAYQRYNAATNSSERTLQTYMGKLLARCGNITFSGAGALSPLMNDPEYATIGVGTRIFLGGGVGFVTGPGTQHNPGSRFGTLMVQGDLKRMSAEFLKAAVFRGYGPTLYIGLGIPIPVLDAGIARCAGIADGEIETNLVDYGVPARERPVLRRVTYAELKSGRVALNGKTVPAAPLASFSKAKEVALLLKEWIDRGRFFLSEPVEKIPKRGAVQPMARRAPRSPDPLFYRRSRNASPAADSGQVSWDEKACIHCGQCLAACPAGVFRHDGDWRIHAATELCTACGQCSGVCPVAAIIGEEIP